MGWTRTEALWLIALIGLIASSSIAALTGLIALLALIVARTEATLTGLVALLTLIVAWTEATLAGLVALLTLIIARTEAALTGLVALFALTVVRTIATLLALSVTLIRRVRIHSGTIRTLRTGRLKSCSKSFRTETVMIILECGSFSVVSALCLNTRTLRTSYFTVTGHLSSFCVVLTAACILFVRQCVIF